MLSEKSPSTEKVLKQKSGVRGCTLDSALNSVISFLRSLILKNEGIRVGFFCSMVSFDSRWRTESDF